MIRKSLILSDLIDFDVYVCVWLVVAPVATIKNTEVLCNRFQDECIDVNGVCIFSYVLALCMTCGAYAHSAGKNPCGRKFKTTKLSSIIP